LTTDTGRDLFLRLAETVDVVVENYTPRVFDQFGITWDALHARNPRLIFARMPAFGLDGPWRDRPGFAQTMDSLSGLAWVTGHTDDQPRLQGGPCDPNAGTHAAFAIIAALARRDETGTGGLLEVPMVESALNIAAEQVIEFSAYGTLRERAGNRGPYAAPQGLYRAGSGWLAVAVPSDEAWTALVDRVAGLAGLDRHRDADAIDEALRHWCADLSAGDAAAQLCAIGVPAAEARDPRRTPEHPGFLSRGFYETADHPVVGPHRVPGLPFRLSGVDSWVRAPAPTLGQHTAGLLGGIGVSGRELEEMERARIVGTTIAD
ncbi:MAG: CoA transferase, partial [Gemmatimonadales bacterium]